MVGLAGEVLLGHFADSGWIKNSGGSNKGGLGELFGPAAKILLEPRGDGHGEAGFFAMEDFGRKIVFESFPKNQFGLAAAHFVVGAKREGVGDEIGVEKGNTNFEGVSHAGAVDFHQDALLKVQFCTKVKNTFKAARETAAVGEAGHIFEGVVALELLASIGGEEIVAFAISARSHPEKKTNFGGQTQSFEKLRHDEGKTFVVVRDGKALDQMVDGHPDSDGKKGEPFHEQMGLEAGVAGKQFIPPIPAQNGFYFSGGELGQEPCWHKGGIAEGFVETAINGGNRLGDIFGREGLVVVLGADLAGDHFGEGKFVVGGLLKTDGEGVKFLFGKRGGQGGHGAGVDSSAEKDSDFHITSELVANSFAKKFASCLGGLIKRSSPDGIILNRKIIKIFGSATGWGPREKLARL